MPIALGGSLRLRPSLRVSEAAVVKVTIAAGATREHVLGLDSEGTFHCAACHAACLPSLFSLLHALHPLPLRGLRAIVLRPLTRAAVALALSLALRRLVFVELRTARRKNVQ